MLGSRLGAGLTVFAGALLLFAAAALALFRPLAGNHEEPRAIAEEHCSEVYPADGPAKGIVIYIHGGAWRGQIDRNGDGVDCDLMRVAESEARRYTRYGYDVWNVDFTGVESTAVPYGEGGKRAVADLVRWHDAVRARTSLPICVAGGSAGAHLALELARRRHVECVIGEGAPTQLVGKGTQTGGPIAQFVFRQAFGEDVAEYSPLHAVDELPRDTRILLGHARCDPLVPPRQARRFAAARRSHLEPGGGAETSTEVHVMDPGKQEFAHTGRKACPGVDRAQYEEYRRSVEEVLVASATGT